jgi:hypothetical protein
MDKVQNCDSYNFWAIDYIPATVTIIIILVVVIQTFIHSLVLFLQ